MKKQLIAAFLSTFLVSAFSTSISASAENDFDSQYLHGFDVDLNYFRKPTWKYHNIRNYYYAGTMVGTCEIDMGVCRAHERPRPGKAYDMFMVNCFMKGRGGYNQTLGTSVYGYSEYVDIYSKMPRLVFLRSYSPTQSPIPGSNSYSLSLSTGGVEASVGIESNALDIYDYSDNIGQTSTNTGYLDIAFDYNHAEWFSFGRWKQNLYSYNSSCQKVSFIVEAWSGYVMDVKAFPSFEIWTKEPCFTARPLHASLEPYVLSETVGGSVGTYVVVSDPAL